LCTISQFVSSVVVVLYTNECELVVLIKQTMARKKNVIVSAITKSFVMTNNLPRIIHRPPTHIASNSMVVVFQFLPNHVYLSKTANPRALISNRINFRSSGEHTLSRRKLLTTTPNESRGIW